uniref:HMG box domain-containing protein n=1 Tax=Panagrolaimus sp. JU765 TaxID=591449 RepID=A0AC34R6T4_9BILA
MFRQPQATPARYQEMRPSRAPEPPLNPYMRFSRKYWHRVRLENQDRPLWDIAKIIANKWREATEDERNEYQQQYEHERIEYEKALKMFLNNPNNQQSALQKRAMKQQLDQRTRRFDANSGVVIQPVNDEDPFEVTPERLAAMRFERNQRLLLAAMRFERNQRLLLEIFNGQALADPRNFISPQRIEALRKQTESLEQHKKRTLDEIGKTEEAYTTRKRAIEKGAEDFAKALKEVSEKRPKVTEEMYNKMIEEQSKKLLEQWESYQKRQEAVKQQQEAGRKETPILYALTVDKTPDAPETTENEEVKMEVDKDGEEETVTTEDKQEQVEGSNDGEETNSTEEESKVEE